MKRDIKILCVDDEPNVLTAVQRVFMDEDYELLTALSGQEGLELLEREENVQVVISDYRMPGMDGVDFLKEVHLRWPATIRVVLSGYADIAAIVSAINEGKIYKFIPKPWNDDELRLAVAQAVDIYVLQQKHREMIEQITRSNENCNRMIHEKNQEILSLNMVLRNKQDVFDALPGGLLVLNENKMIVECNRSCRKFFGNVEQKLSGRPAGAVLPPEVRALLDTITEEGWADNLRFSDRRFQVRWKLMPPVQEQYGAQWIIEFWEGMANQ